MQRYLDVSRAAKLAGVSRSEIQRLIAERTLPTFEGRVEVTELVRVFPEIQLSRSTMVEVVSQIKDDAIHKAARMSPGFGQADAKQLQAETLKLERDLVYYRDLADKYKNILVELRPKLEVLKEKSEHKHRIQSIINWFAHKTKELW